MRNLKKVLSLTLALVMMLSMMTFAGAAETTKVSTATDLTDMKDVANKEAVTLLVDLKVVAGRDNGAFDPAGSLKRAEFAKLVYVAKMGSDDKAVNFVNAATGLTDVAGTWFEGYVNYAYSTGIVSGTSKTTFTPAGLVKVAEAAKMLLVGLGYDAKAEGYSDNALWSVNVMQQAKQSGLLEGIKLGANVALTRDAAAQMVFNALMAKTVTNTYGFDMNGKKYITGATVNKTTWGEEVFNLQKVTGIVTGISDKTGNAQIDKVLTTLPAAPEQIGSKVAYYKNSSTGKLISTALAVSASTVLGTSTNGTALADLGNVDKAAYIATEDNAVTYYSNGKVVLKGAAVAEADLAGVIVDLLDNDDNGKFDVVRLTNKTVATVGDDGVKVTAATVASKKDTVTISGVTAIQNVIIENVRGYEGLKAEDVILYVKIGNVFYVEKAAVVEGKIVSSKTVDSVASYMMGGTGYAASELSDESAQVNPFNSFNNFNKDIALYLDNNGTVVVAKLLEAAAKAQYAVVLDAAWVTGNGSLTSSQYAEAKLLYVDGTTEIVKLSKFTAADGTTVTKFKYASGSMDDNGDVIGVSGKLQANKIYAFSKDSTDNTVALAAVKSPMTMTKIDTDGVITPNKPAFATGFKGNSATVFLIANTDADGTTYSVKTGIANAPKFDGTSTFKATGFVLVKDGFATIVMIENGEDSNTVTKDDMVYFTSTDFDAFPAVKDVSPAYRVYNAIVDGKVTTVKVKDDAVVVTDVKATLMDVIYNADGYITTVTSEGDADSNAVANKGTVKVANGLLGLGNATDGVGYYTYTTDTVVFFIEDGVATAGKVSDITTDANDTVYITVVDSLKDASQPLSYVYITKVANIEGGTGGSDAATGYTVTTAPTFTAGANRVTFAAGITAKDAAATGTVTTAVNAYMLAPNGAWVKMSTKNDTDTLSAGSECSISTDVAGVVGTTYKFEVTITFNNEITTIHSDAVMIITAV